MSNCFFCKYYIGPWDDIGQCKALPERTVRRAGDDSACVHFSFGSHVNLIGILENNSRLLDSRSESAEKIKKLNARKMAQNKQIKALREKVAVLQAGGDEELAATAKKTVANYKKLEMINGRLHHRLDFCQKEQALVQQEKEKMRGLLNKAYDDARLQREKSLLFQKENTTLHDELLSLKAASELEKGSVHEEASADESDPVNE